MFTPLSSTLARTFALLALTAPAHLFAQTTINVGPGQTYTTIQSGINAAFTGDTVLVAPGTYYENIDFMGKAITVTSSGGTAVTTIDGGGVGSTVTMKTQEPRTAVLSNFTITHGGFINSATATPSGSGITISNSAPTILNNIITKNYCQNIQAEGAGPLIQGNVVSSSLNAAQCSFQYTGGIQIGGSSYSPQGTPIPPYVAWNTIENNTTGETGGGSGDGGSGIWIDTNSNLAIVNNIIRNNTTNSGLGGGILVYNASVVAMVNNLLYGNYSGCGGGAIAFQAAGVGSPYTMLIANNTIADNTAGTSSDYNNCIQIAQIYPDPATFGSSGPNVGIINNIISGDTSYPAVNCSSTNSPSESDQPAFQNDILYNSGGPFFGSFCIDVSTQYNNIVADPQFASPSTGNYHLKSTSPAIDSGQNDVLQFLLAMTGQTLTSDLDGNPRVQNATGKGCIIDMGAYEYPGTHGNCSTTETLQSSLNPSPYGQTVTFTAQLSATNGVPTGDVQFADGGVVLGTETISSTGVSTFSTGLLAVGSHTITATYQPTGNFFATSATLVQAITGTPTNTNLTCNPSTIFAGSTSLFTAVVTSSNGTPTGSIIFTDNGTSFGQPTLTNGDASFTYTGQTAATHTIVGTYSPTGGFDSSSAACTVTVNTLPSTAILTVVPTSINFGNPVALTATVSATNPPGPSTPTGTVTFSYTTSTDPAAVTLGTVTLSAIGVASLTTTALPVGEDNLSCTYSGSSIYSPATCVSQSAGSPTLTLTSSANPAAALTPITFTAQLGAGSSGTMVSGGSIVFAINGQSFTASPNANGAATYTISTLTAGSYPVTATWFASPNAPAIAQASLTQVVAGVPDFSLTGSSITFPLGHSATGDLELASLNGFAGNVAIACLPPFPPNYTCSLQHSSISLTSGLSTVFTYTLRPSYTAGIAPSHPFNRSTRIALASLFPLTLLLLTGLARRKRLTHLRTLLALTCLAILTGATTACGPDHFISATTGTYPITFTATGTNQGSSTPITHTLTINATLAP